MKLSVLPQIRSHKKVSLMILLVGISIVFLPSASGFLIQLTNLEKYLESELIVFGEVTSLRDLQDGSNETSSTVYEIAILQSIKGNAEADEITAVGFGSLNSTRQLEGQTIMSKGQQAILLLNFESDGFWHISPHSVSLPSLDPDTQFILSPLKLYKAGIPVEDIHCKSSLELAIKSSNGHPVCITPESFDILLERKWIR